LECVLQENTLFKYIYFFTVPLVTLTTHMSGSYFTPKPEEWIRMHGILYLKEAFLYLPVPGHVLLDSLLSQCSRMLHWKTCSSWSKRLIISGRSCNDCVKVVLVTWRGLVCFKSTVIIQTKARPNCPVKQSSCHWAAADLFSGQGWSIFAVSQGQKEGSDRLSRDI